MKIAVAGCVHGELEQVYVDLKEREEKEKIKIDLVLICGDFQAVRNNHDLNCMHVPPKFRRLGTFHHYYSGERKAPYLTIFIGGNHEASNYLSTLPYGGWVAENIYYLGYASVVNFGGLRIAGISGIHKKFDVYHGHYEHLPYDKQTLTSVYHVRALEAYRMCQIANETDKQPVDIVLSHDWPLNIHQCGNVRYLLQRKPFFKDDIDRNQLGNPLFEPLVHHLKPRHWFSAHLHVRFQATVTFDNSELRTEFLALDKCLPRRPYLEVLDINPKPGREVTGEPVLEYDAEWLCILRKTNKYMSHEKQPKHQVPSIWIIADPITEQDLAEVRQLLNNDLAVPKNFQLCEPVAKVGEDSDPRRSRSFPNPQSVEFCSKLSLLDPISEIVRIANLPVLGNPDQIDLDDEEWEEQEQPADEDDPAIIKKIKVGEAGDEQAVQGTEETPLFFIDTKGKR